MIHRGPGRYPRGLQRRRFATTKEAEASLSAGALDFRIVACRGDSKAYGPTRRGGRYAPAPMPLYRYHCTSCDHRFEELVSSREAAAATAVACPQCASAETERELTTFAVRGEGAKADPMPYCGRCGENRPPCDA